MRITEHPILDFARGKKIKFTYNGQELEGFEGETIAAALHANGVRTMRESIHLHRPRGLFCNIGNCSSCLMIVNGKPNVRVCVEKLQEGMIVMTQKGKGELKC
ncbi:MAG: sarcosine oxidase, alpha subunit [Peptococcaceae bacterium]|jgi:predicted molibdopterin-dependent oxidoreductase YjgC|nr:sarcosine oxidase, alpha subunit [Peptococcaceae bacterium]